MKIVFTGSIGRLPLGGHAWIQMQYLAGLIELGHDVLYLEDCGEASWVYRWDTQEVTADLDYPAAYVEGCMTTIGMPPERWVYRTHGGARGLPLQALDDFVRQAELLIVWAVPLTIWRPAYLLPRRRIFIDADPGFTQISVAQGEPGMNETVGNCHHLFTIAQRIGREDCTIPSAGREWHRTVAPICARHWTQADSALVTPWTPFTSVMQWRGFREVEFEGIRYGQKDLEFPRFLDLPRRTRQPLRLAMTGGDAATMQRHGWEVVDGWIPSRTPDSYRDFIHVSRAEFGVAKQGYVRSRGGWFSDRSVCYLASGRPVLLQDTGQADFLPVGLGIVLFRDLDEAVEGINQINLDYPAHCAAARALAEEHFDTRRVLPPLLDVAMG